MLYNCNTFTSLFEPYAVTRQAPQKAEFSTPIITTRVDTDSY